MKHMYRIVLFMAAAASSGFAQDRPVQDFPGTVAHPSVAPLLGVTPKETLKATYEDSIHNGGIFTFCSTAGCLAPTATIDSLNLECPVVAGKTCTYDIQLSGQVQSGGESIVNGEEGLYRFFVDGFIPNGGGTDPNGFYAWQLFGPSFQFTASYGVHSTVTNTTANQTHNVTVGVACLDVLQDPRGCFANAGFQNVVVKVLTP